MAIISFFFSQSKQYMVKYLLFDFLYLLLQFLVLLFGCLVLSFKLVSIHFTSTAQHTLKIVNCISRFLWLFVQLDQDFGELIDCACLLKVFLELLFLGFDSSLGYQRITCDIEFKNKFYKQIFLYLQQIYTWFNTFQANIVFSYVIIILAIMRVLAFFLIIAFINAKSSAKDLSEPKYTENIQQFKKDNQRGRMELLLGCYLMAREYSNDTNQAYQVGLIKKCMKKISRKDSVVKITSLIGKNMAPPKKYEDIVALQQLKAEAIQIQQMSEFDQFLLGYIKGYEKDLSNVQLGKESAELKKQMEQELTKRQKYYFGFIPANKYTLIMIVISATFCMITLCACWKYYSKKTQKENQKKQMDKFFNKYAGKQAGSKNKSKRA